MQHNNSIGPLYKIGDEVLWDGDPPGARRTVCDCVPRSYALSGAVVALETSLRPANGRHIEPQADMSVDGLRQLISSYLNAYECGLTAQESACLDQMRRVRADHERQNPAAVKLAHPKSEAPESMGAPLFTSREMRRYLILAVACIVAAVLVSVVAHAASNLPITCSTASAEGQPAGACQPSAQVFAEATEGTLVRACNIVSCPYTERGWTRFANVNSAQYVEICASEKPPGTPATECQGATSSQWGAMAMVPRSQVSQAVEAEPQFPGTFTVTPSTGVSPLAVTIAWDASGFTGGTCAASGSWSGAKPLAGTQNTSVTANASYTLSCSRSVPTGSASLSWTAPTQNTDGSALTNLAGFRVHWGANPAALTQSMQVANPGATNFIVSNLDPSTWYFGVRAYNATGAESDLSNIVSKTISTQTPSYSLTRSVTVTTVPLPPTLQVVEAQVFNATADYALLAFRPSIRYGSAPLGTPCDPTKPVRGGYYPVPLDAVAWSSTARTKYPVAKCVVR